MTVVGKLLLEDKTMVAVFHKMNYPTVNVTRL